MKTLTLLILVCLISSQASAQFLAGDNSFVETPTFPLIETPTLPIARRVPVITPTVQTPAARPLPPPPVVVPPPAPVKISPTLLGNGSSSENALNQLNGFIDRFSGTNLLDATISGFSQTFVPPVSQPVVQSVLPITTRVNPALAGGFSARFNDGNVETPTFPTILPPPPVPQGIREINLNVNGWGYLVLQWGNVNHHFYVGDSSGVQTFRGTAPLSSYTYFQSAAPTASVPDNGLTGVMLAMGLVGLVGARFFSTFKRKA